MGAREWMAVSNETIAEGVQARVVAVEGNALRIQAI
jgi:membrane protein implicated in regulation of membrane protease activity